MRVPVHVEYDEELKVYSAYVPDIPGCGEGTTETKAIDDLRESLRAHIEGGKGKTKGKTGKGKTGPV